MENVLTTFVDYLLGWGHSFFAEFVILLLLVGLAFILLGTLIVFHHIKTHILGKKFIGKVIGAVKDVKVTIKDGKVTKRILNHGTLWPVFE